METLSNCGGGKRIRTADPLHAMQVLYQLSYTPEEKTHCIEHLSKNQDPYEIFLALLKQSVEIRRGHRQSPQVCNPVF